MLSSLDSCVLRLVLDAIRNYEAHGHAEKQANRDEEPQQICVFVWRREQAAAHAWVPIWSRHVVVAEQALGSSHEARAERHRVANEAAPHSHARAKLLRVGEVAARAG